MLYSSVVQIFSWCNLSEPVECAIENIAYASIIFIAIGIGLATAKYIFIRFQIATHGLDLLLDPWLILLL